MNKTCSKCNSQKDLSLFIKNRNVCKKCKSEYDKYLYNENREEVKGRRKKFYIENKELSLETSRKYHIKNKERILQQQREYYLLNKENRLTTSKRWREANPERNKKLMKEWAAKNPHKMIMHSSKRRSAKLNAVAKWGNEFFIEEVYELARRRTKATGLRYEVDHIVPLQNKLVCGLHWEGNFQIITKEENLSKGNRWWPGMPGTEKE